MWKLLPKVVFPILALPVTALFLSGQFIPTRSRTLPQVDFAPANAGGATSVDESPWLTQGELIQRDLSTGESHIYLIALGSGQYFHAALERWGMGDRIALYSPAGQTLAELNCRRNGPTPVSLIAASSGIYKLEIRSLETDKVTGHYEIRIEQVRRATAKDSIRIAAEKASAEGEELRAEEKAESQRKAIKKYQEALLTWKAAGDRREETGTLEDIGELYYYSGEFGTALKYYKQSLLLSKAANDRSGESKALNGIGSAYISLGQTKRARQICIYALSLSRATGDRRSEAQALNNIGEVYNWSGDLQKALEFYDQSLRLWVDLGDRRGRARSLMYFGYTYSDLGETQKAFDSYTRALSLWQTLNDNHGKAITLTAMGRLYSRSGESQEALKLFDQAMRLIQPIGDPIEEARIYTGIAYIYDVLGEKRRAIEFYNQALPLFRKASYPCGEAQTLYDIGSAYYSLRDYQSALECYQRTLAIGRTTAEQRIAVYALRGIGTIYDAAGNKAKALTYYNQTLSFYRAGKDRRGEADTLNMIGRIYDERGEKQKALTYYSRALPLSRAAQYRFGESSTLYNIAHVERGRGNLDEARARISAALGIAESLRSKVDGQELRADYFASVHQYYELYIDLLMQLHKQRPAEGFDAAALEASERARARSLLETMAEARVPFRQDAPPALLERERSLRQELDEKAERRMRLLGSRHTEAGTDALVKEIDELTIRYDEVEARIRTASPRYAALRQAQPLSFKEIQRQITDDDTLLLEYALGDERSYLWTVTKTTIDGYELPGRSKIESAANFVRKLLLAHQRQRDESFAQYQERVKEADAQYWPQAAALGEMLFGQVAVPSQIKRLVIIPDGALQYIPFEALPAPETVDGSRGLAGADSGSGRVGPVPLIEKYEIVYQPSASTLAVLREQTGRRKAPPRGIAVLADPVFETDDPRLESKGEMIASAATPNRDVEIYRALRDVGITEDGVSIPRLPASREEAEAIIKASPVGASLKVVGFEASKALATSPELARYRIIHFATHGLLDSEHPELSCLVLSLVDREGRPQDGFLRLNDIYNLNLPAEMVVLSACNTGLGKDVRGEGLIGLTRGFMYAGAERVIASLWKVDDEATAELMSNFYRQMLQEGKPPAAALRAAQLAIFKQERWRSPYYWGAFVMQGEYKEKVTLADIAPAGLNRHQTTLAATFIVLLGAIYIIGRFRKGTHRPMDV